MASARKKQDEKHLKALRSLASASSNRYCFDCRQRGPTYVNVTIGSFVCTKCSGILRGLTPPHRVKSMSMATFTQEEVDQLMSKGNEYCQKVWLALCESEPPTKDEQLIKDFMIDKYEKKRYYVEPSIAMKMSSFNGMATSSQNNSSSNSATSNLSNSSVLSRTKAQESNGLTKTVDNNNSKVYMNGNVNPLDRGLRASLSQDPFEPSQPSFANFDNASIFNATSAVPGTGCLMSGGSGSGGSAVPTEDRYAALKDLDCLMKSQIAAAGNSVAPQTRGAAQPQQPQETLHPPVPPSDPWGNSVSSVNTNGSLWGSTPPVGPKEAANLNGFTSNPFANDNNWMSESSINNGELSKNPFKNSKLFSDCSGTNGSSDMTTSQSFSTFQWLSSSSHANPFAVGGFAGSPPTNSAYHSNNPFL